VDTLVALSDNALNSLEVRSLSGPISGGSRAVFFSCEDAELVAFFDVTSSSIVNGHDISSRDVHGGGSGLLAHLVNQSHVSESSTCHHSVVSSAGSI